MPRGDFRHREAKKPKKDAKKPAATSVLPTSVAAEVAAKKRKPREKTEE